MKGLVELNVDVYSLPYSRGAILSTYFSMRYSLQTLENGWKSMSKRNIKGVFFCFCFLFLFFISAQIFTIFYFSIYWHSWCQTCVDIEYWCLFPYFHNILSLGFWDGEKKVPEILAIFITISTQKAECKSFTQIMAM